jgi:predicted transcriptional regulator of viral defense system
MKIDIESMVETAVGNHLRDITARELADMQLVTIREAASLLGVGEAMARRLLGEYVELGEASRRYRVATVRRLIEARTFSK